jgi:RHS repeat-associated protein
VETIEYGPWGEIFAQSGAGVHSFGFAGGMWDRDTDLVRFGARWYDPEIGRWIMKDPIGFGGGQANLYVYVANDPVNYTDSSGLAPGQVYFSRGAAVEDTIDDLRKLIAKPGKAIDWDNPEMGTEVYQWDFPVFIPLPGIWFYDTFSIYSYYKPTRPVFAGDATWAPSGDCPGKASLELHTHPNDLAGSLEADRRAAEAEDRATMVVGPTKLWYYPSGTHPIDVELRGNFGKRWHQVQGELF